MLGHDPGDETWHNGQGRSINLGLDMDELFALDPAGEGDATWDYPDADFAAVPGNIEAGSISGRRYAEWLGSSGAGEPAGVTVAHEISATITGTRLSGTLRFIYRMTTRSRSTGSGTYCRPGRRRTSSKRCGGAEDVR